MGRWGVGENLGRLGEGETVIKIYCIKKSIFKIVLRKKNKLRSLEEQIPSFPNETL